MARQADRKLELEQQAARVLREHLAGLTDDEGAIADTIEGSTNLHEAIAAVVADILDDRMLVDGIDKMISDLASRKSRLDARTERRRGAILRAMEVGEIKTLALPAATLSLRNTPPGLEITDDLLIPAEYWKPQPDKLDRTALKNDLKAGHQIPGATLGNGSISLAMRIA